jgi:hypothetical protein
MIKEGDFFPCERCEHNGDCDRGFECPRLEAYYINNH